MDEAREVFYDTVEEAYHYCSTAASTAFRRSARAGRSAATTPALRQRKEIQGMLRRGVMPLTPTLSQRERELHDPQPDSRYAAFRLAITLALMTIGASAMYVVPVVLPAVQAEFGIARADASLPYRSS